MSGNDWSSPPLIAFAVLVLVWLVAEGLSLKTPTREFGNRDAASRHDRGSIWLILAWLGLALVVSLGLFDARLGGFFPIWVLTLGVPLAVVGVTVRCWAISSLGRFLSPVIRIEPDHRIIRQGPYRWLRHPSYTGVWLASTGAVLALGTISGFLVTAGLGLLVLGYRICLEERMLTERFGSEYAEYARSTWRLIPGVY